LGLMFPEFYRIILTHRFMKFNILITKLISYKNPLWIYLKQMLDHQTDQLMGRDLI
jgi:hypothetical protein